MLVYRIENADGIGPYRCRNNLYDMGMRHQDGNVHPTPESEGIDYLPRHVCGFESIEKYLAWFMPIDRIELQNAGFRLVTYHADAPMTGNRQLMFDPATAKRIDHFDPVDLEPVGFENDEPHKLPSPVFFIDLKLPF